ncbi:maleylpyruvate isomerase family mycothiol-dependent enzyme [Nigerium massiliense]|uniref:maleylpyruvate isomerase family mycothiol-dependent enzyme n=1 Tax=Nigerium massiliense TaxID=1522317 RepID=UPI0012FD8EE0|nr:maleylpyruvate isomerase family mycothiol-dependent enzyme [Nigerium massiliense]
MAERRALHEEALLAADGAIQSLTDSDGSKPSRCEGWTIKDLVEHMTGQNIGFAEAIATGDAPLGRYRPASASQWSASVAGLRGAIERPASSVRLAEVAPGQSFELDRVLAIHALDLAVHTWDLGGGYRPGGELAGLVLLVARATPPRGEVGGPFAPALPGDESDPWAEALALLGRHHG